MVSVRALKAPAAVVTLALALQTPGIPLRAQTANDQTIAIDARAQTTAFPHVWEQMFGSGRAVLSLRESYRDDLRSVRDITGFEFIRFHGVLDDDVGVLEAAPGERKGGCDAGEDPERGPW